MCWVPQYPNLVTPRRNRSPRPPCQLGTVSVEMASRHPGFLLSALPRLRQMAAQMPLAALTPSKTRSDPRKNGSSKSLTGRTVESRMAQVVWRLGEDNAHQRRRQEASVRFTCCCVRCGAEPRRASARVEYPAPSRRRRPRRWMGKRPYKMAVRVGCIRPAPIPCNS